MQLTPDIITGSVAMLIGSALYAVSVVIYRSQKDEITPLAISSIKMWIALGFMSLMILFPFWGNPLMVPIESTVLLSISVICGAVIGDTLYLTAQERIGVSYAFPISMSFPILTYFFTIIFLNEALILSRLIGVLVAVIGISILALEQEFNNDKHDAPERRNGLDRIGLAFALLTALLYATGTTILQVGVADVEPVAATFIRVVVGSITFVPLIAVAKSIGMPNPTRNATKMVAIAGFFGMAVGSLLYVTGIKYAGATIGSVLASLAPLYAVPISIIFLKESMTSRAGIGAIATIIGVILVILGV
ncbi:MAG: DMT family transporter [Candidatus Thorarchaeota archaeon]